MIVTICMHFSEESLVDLFCDRWFSFKEASSIPDLVACAWIPALETEAGGSP